MPKPTRIRKNFYLTRLQTRWLRSQSALTGNTESAVVRRLIEDAIAEMPG
jgi:hypothetical protein